MTDADMPLEEEAASGTLITFEENIDDGKSRYLRRRVRARRSEDHADARAGPPGIAYQILGPIADANVDVDMIVQNISVDGTTDFSFTVHRNEYEKAIEVLESKVKDHVGAKQIVGDPKIAKVSIVGIGMRSHVGIASLMFRTLAEEGINMQMISTSEIKISVVVEDKYMELAVRALHKAFGLEHEPA